jgi:hypothetical protein
MMPYDGAIVTTLRYSTVTFLCTFSIYKSNFLFNKLAERQKQNI